MTGFASKAAEHAARIAGVLALWRDLDAQHVTEEDMGNGIELAQFYLTEAVRLADAAKVSLETVNAEKLRVWLIEKWGQAEVLPGDVVQHGPPPLRDTKKAKAAIAYLVQHGWLVALEPGTIVRGKPRRAAYRIVRPGRVV